MAYCGEHTAVKSSRDQATIVTLRCKSWTCPECREQRQDQLIAQAIGGKPNKFLTLTSRRVEGITPEQAAKRLSWAWRVCRLRLMRHYKLKELPFLAVVERHLSGWPHMHVLLRSPWLDQRLISKWMAELCDGPRVWIVALQDAGRAAVYCSKYAGKCVQKVGTTKRYWQTRDYDQREKPEDLVKNRPGEGWELWQKNLEHMIHCFETWGYSVKRKSYIRAEAQKIPP